MPQHPTHHDQVTAQASSSTTASCIPSPRIPAFIAASHETLTVVRLADTAEVELDEELALLGLGDGVVLAAGDGVLMSASEAGTYAGGHLREGAGSPRHRGDPEASSIGDRCTHLHRARVGGGRSAANLGDVDHYVCVLCSVMLWGMWMLLKTTHEATYIHFHVLCLGEQAQHRSTVGYMSWLTRHVADCRGQLTRIKRPVRGPRGVLTSAASPRFTSFKQRQHVDARV